MHYSLSKEPCFLLDGVTEQLPPHFIPLVLGFINLLLVSGDNFLLANNLSTHGLRSPRSLSLTFSFIASGAILYNMAECCISSFLLVMLFLFPLLFYFSRAVRFQTKICIHYLNMTLASLLPIPLAIFTPKDPTNTNYASFILRTLSKLIFDISWNVNGLEHIQTQEAAVVVCNHQSSLDVIAMMVLWPKLYRCVPVVKKELLFAGPFGILSWLSGSVFLNRSKSAESHDTLNKVMKKLAKEKTKIWVFPEGTRNDKGTMLPFKKGAFHLAIQAELPIIPIVISSYSPFYEKSKNKFDNGGKIEITALPAIQTKGLTVNDVGPLSENVRNIMIKAYDEIEEKLGRTAPKTEMNSHNK